MSNYINEVSDLFIQRRGSTLFLSPLDWQIIARWESSGIPLHVVCRAIDEQFDKRQRQPKAKQRPVKSISYCAEEIDSAFENWLELKIGK